MGAPVQMGYPGGGGLSCERIEDRLIRLDQQKQLEMDLRRWEAAAIAQYLEEASQRGTPMIGPPPRTGSSAAQRGMASREEGLQAWGLEKDRRREAQQALAQALEDDNLLTAPLVSPGSQKILAARAALRPSNGLATAPAAVEHRLLEAGAARTARLANQAAAYDTKERARAERTAKKTRDSYAGRAVGDRLYSAGLRSQEKKAAAAARAEREIRALATPPSARRKTAGHKATLARMHADEEARQNRMTEARAKVLEQRHASPEISVYIAAAKTTRQATQLASASSPTQRPPTVEAAARLARRRSTSTTRQRCGQQPSGPAKRRALMPSERIAGWDQMGAKERRAAVQIEHSARRLNPAAMDDDAMLVVFRQWDVNGNGHLSLAEIDKAVVEQFPWYGHKAALMRAYKAADADGNGWIGQREFRKLLHFVVYFNKLWHIFEQLDADNDHRIQKAEFISSASKIPGLEQLSPRVAAAKFDRIDADGGAFAVAIQTQTVAGDGCCCGRWPRPVRRVLHMVCALPHRG